MHCALQCADGGPKCVLPNQQATWLSQMRGCCDNLHRRNLLRMASNKNLQRSRMSRWYESQEQRGFSLLRKQRLHRHYLLRRRHHQMPWSYGELSRRDAIQRRSKKWCRWHNCCTVLHRQGRMQHPYLSSGLQAEDRYTLLCHEHLRRNREQYLLRRRHHQMRWSYGELSCRDAIQRHSKKMVSLAQLLHCAAPTRPLAVPSIVRRVTRRRQVHIIVLRTLAPPQPTAILVVRQRPPNAREWLLSRAHMDRVITGTRQKQALLPPLQIRPLSAAAQKQYVRNLLVRRVKGCWVKLAVPLLPVAPKDLVVNGFQQGLAAITHVPLV
jgi:hypothetical protein